MKRFIVALIIILILAGCIKKSRQEENKPDIVVTSPEIAEIICALGAENRISGVTRECNYPPSLLNKPIVGTFGKVDIEKIIALAPEIIFTAGMEQDFTTTELQKLSLRVEKVFPAGIDDMLDAVTRISTVMNISEKGEKLRIELENEIQILRETLPEKRKRVYLEINGNPLMSVSDESYVGELFELAGYDNVFSTLPRVYSRISAESVLESDPEYIFTLYPGINSEQIAGRKGWEKISAVQTGKIFTEKDINPDLVVRATPRSIRYAGNLRDLMTHE